MTMMMIMIHWHASGPLSYIDIHLHHHTISSSSGTLQDNKSIYFIQQFVPGGDLFSLLYGSRKEGGSKSVFPSTKEGGIPIEYAAFYVVNAVTAIHHLHYHGIIHRDLKIENFVSDQCSCMMVDLMYDACHSRNHYYHHHHDDYHHHYHYRYHHHQHYHHHHHQHHHYHQCHH